MIIALPCHTVAHKGGTESTPIHRCTHSLCVLLECLPLPFIGSSPSSSPSAIPARSSPFHPAFPLHLSVTHHNPTPPFQLRIYFFNYVAPSLSSLTFVYFLFVVFSCFFFSICSSLQTLHVGLSASVSQRRVVITLLLL